MNSGRSKIDRYYECRDCGHRTAPASYRARCSRCGGELRNIGVPRE